MTSAGLNEKPAKRKEIGVGLIGVGNVGSRVADALVERGDYFARQVGVPIVLRKAAVRDLKKPRSIVLDPGILTGDAADVINHPEIDIVVELIGGEDPAGAYVRQAIDAGKNVVTANKELIAKSGPELIAAAHAAGVDIMFEASVGGGIPIISPLQRDLLANRINAIRAIINGTTNYILTSMARDGEDYETALKEAQRLGYAEPDPTNDVEGYDAAYKLAIMVHLAFRARIAPGEIVTEGISKLAARDFQYARELGYVIKLLAIAEQTGDRIIARVGPSLLPESEPLARVDDVYNAIQVDGDLTGRVMFQGAGAGSGPTTSAVVADILDLSHSLVHGNMGRREWGPPNEIPVLGLDALETRYYVRVNVADRPGVLAKIATVLGENGVSIAAVNQKEADEEQGTAELVIMTHRARETALRTAISQIAALEVVADVATVLRVEGEQ